MRKYCVYLHCRQTNGLPFYVGKGTSKRPKSLRDRSIRWHRTAAKYGWYVKIVKNNMEEHCAFSLEKALIAAIGRENLCNLTNGGDGCSKKCTSEAAEKIRRSLTGRKLTDAHKKSISIGQTGKRHKIETKIKQSESKKLRTIYTFANVNGFKFVGIRYDFIVKYCLDPSEVTKVIKGKAISVKGWSVVS